MKASGPSERQIQETCDGFLTLDGWRLIKTDLPHLRGLGVQEKGMPDRLYIRYLHDCEGIQCSCDKHGATGRAEIMWCEWKKRGGKAAQHQKTWHYRERLCGALTLIAGEDFPASIEGFMDWYAKSGLQRRKVTMGAVGGRK